MGGVVKTHRRQKYNYNKNRRRAWKKSKKMPAIECDKIKNAWDSKKSITGNLADMGLSSDPNKTLPIPKAKDMMAGPEVESLSKYINEGEGSSSKDHVAQSLEAEANAPQAKRLLLSEPEVNYCIHMIEKYGEDYKAMARDRKNYYQDTPKQIRKKISTFKNIPSQYNAYLKSKETVESVNT